MLSRAGFSEFEGRNFLPADGFSKKIFRQELFKQTSIKFRPNETWVSWVLLLLLMLIVQERQTSSMQKRRINLLETNQLTLQRRKTYVSIIDCLLTYLLRFSFQFCALVRSLAVVCMPHHMALVCRNTCAIITWLVMWSCHEMPKNTKIIQHVRAKWCRLVVQCTVNYFRFVCF